MVIGKGQTKACQSAIKYKHDAEEGPVTVHEFPDMANRANMNKEETTDGKAWAAMGQYEVQDKFKSTDKTDIIEIYILSYYWKCLNVMLMIKVTGLYTFGDESIKVEDVKADLTRRTSAISYYDQNQCETLSEVLLS